MTKIVFRIFMGAAICGVADFDSLQAGERSVVRVGKTGFSQTKLSTETVFGNFEGGTTLGGAGISFGSNKSASSSGSGSSNSSGAGSGNKAVGAAGKKKCDIKRGGGKGNEPERWDCYKKCPKVGWPALVEPGSGYFSDSINWGHWYSGDAFSGPPPSGPDAEFNGSYHYRGMYMRGAYSSRGYWYNQCNGSAGSPWYPDDPQRINAGIKSNIPPETVCTTTHDRAAIMKKVAVECAERVAYYQQYYASLPPAPPPPPAMTNEEKIEWCMSNMYNVNRVVCITRLPYISDYAKYPGLDVRGAPLPPPQPDYFYDPENW